MRGSLSRRDGKNPEIRGVAKIGTAFAMLPASVRDTARSQRERRKDAERNHQSLPPPRHLLRDLRGRGPRSEEHTSDLQSLMRISYAVFCLKTQKTTYKPKDNNSTD